MTLSIYAYDDIHKLITTHLYVHGRSLKINDKLHAEHSGSFLRYERDLRTHNILCYKNGCFVLVIPQSDMSIKINDIY